MGDIMFSTSIHKRVKIVFLVVVFCFVLIICKVFYIQVVDYDKLNGLANSLWSRNLPIEADRGRIYTSDNEIVADNLTTVSLVFIPNQIDNDLKAEIASSIAKILDCDVSAIEEHIYKKSSIERVHPEGRRLSYEEADRLIEQLLELENPYNCPHGRPTIISMSKYEIEKKFKRII